MNDDEQLMRPNELILEAKNCFGYPCYSDWKGQRLSAYFRLNYPHARPGLDAFDALPFYLGDYIFRPKSHLISAKAIDQHVWRP